MITLKSGRYFMKEVIQYHTQGTCCKVMQIVIEDNKICEVQFLGGCPGNLLGIANLVKNMEIDHIIERFQGIQCGDKPTSCPDQLAKCLLEYKSRKALVQKGL